MTRDVDWRMRKVAALRALCLTLPHEATPAETERLQRFDELARAPDLATAADLDAIVTGWRAWWRQGRLAEILAMAARLPGTIVEHDRRATTYVAAARQRGGRES